MQVNYNLKNKLYLSSEAELLHLLRRCLFGVGKNEWDFFRGKNLVECVTILLTQSPPPPIPILEDKEVVDPLVEWGNPWVNAPYENDFIDNRRGIMLQTWWIGRLISRDTSLTAKMTLFWHNHFVTQMDIVKDSRYSYQYVNLLHAHALGNFKKLILEGTTNPAMLVYLNGNTNTKNAPNENYARELLELFTIGKGKGSKYTEDDVRAAARVLTGWKDDKEKITSLFNPELHDTGDKQFSSFFDNKIIKGKSGNEGVKEIAELIEMILEQKETARFVCRNLYRWFVTSDINEQTEKYIIEPLSETFRANNFEIKPVLKQLLSSEHFYDPAFRGCIVKSPVDFLIGAMHQFDVIASCKLRSNFLPWADFHAYMSGMAMDVTNPPSVAGWMAYYQPPKFHQWWINSSSLGLRNTLMKKLSQPEGVLFNSFRTKFSFTHFIAQFSQPENTEMFIDECTQLLLPVPLTPVKKTQLVQLLNSHRRWAEAWKMFKENPEDKKIIAETENILRPFFAEIMSLPEYQLM